MDLLLLRLIAALLPATPPVKQRHHFLRLGQLQVVVGVEVRDEAVTEEERNVCLGVVPNMSWHVMAWHGKA